MSAPHSLQRAVGSVDRKVDAAWYTSGVSLNIKNADAERLARQLAAATGESVTRAVAVAVRERLDRLQHGDELAAVERGARVRKIAEDAAGRWVEPYRSSDHSTFLYDESGLPR